MKCYLDESFCVKWLLLIGSDHIFVAFYRIWSVWKFRQKYCTTASLTSNISCCAWCCCHIPSHHASVIYVRYCFIFVTVASEGIWKWGDNWQGPNGRSWRPERPTRRWGSMWFRWIFMESIKTIHFWQPSGISNQKNNVSICPDAYMAAILNFTNWLPYKTVFVNISAPEYIEIWFKRLNHHFWGQRIQWYDNN